MMHKDIYYFNKFSSEEELDEELSEDLDLEENNLPEVSDETISPESYQYNFNRQNISGIKELLTRPIPRTRAGLGVRPNMRDGEILGRGKSNIKKVYNEATDEEKDFWGNWYHKAQSDVQNLSSMFKVPLDTMAAVVAVLSPGNKWVDNLMAAAKLMRGDRVVNAWPKNIEKALRIKETNTPTISGPKVTLFYQSLINPQSTKRHVVLDGHAINVWMGLKYPLRDVPKVGKALRERIAEDYRKAADELGAPPQSVQAVTWYVWKCLPFDEPKVGPAPLSNNPAAKK